MITQILSVLQALISLPGELNKLNATMTEFLFEIKRHNTNSQIANEIQAMRLYGNTTKLEERFKKGAW